MNLQRRRRPPPRGAARLARTSWVIGSLWTCLFLLGCSSERPMVSFDFDPKEPVVNELVHFVDRSSDPNGAQDLLAWEWTFGDGGTATGRDVWHQYRSPSRDAGAAAQGWPVTLTVTDVEGNKGVGLESVCVADPALTGLAGYCLQQAGTSCLRADGPRPEMPGECWLPSEQEDVLTSWWLAPMDGRFYLLAELYMVPPEVSRATCTWTARYRGNRLDGTPGPAQPLGREEHVVEPTEAYAVGFLLEVQASQAMPQPGWYQVFADVRSSVGEYRDVIDFLLNVGAGP